MAGPVLVESSKEGELLRDTSVQLTFPTEGVNQLVAFAGWLLKLRI
jgi:hypothetical protein